MNKTNSLLKEILSSQGFINIDQNDIDRFRANVKNFDAEKVSGKDEEVGVILDNAISSIKKRNDGKQIKRLLFVIRLPQENNFMEHISNVRDVVGNFGDEFECIWGFSTIDSLQGNEIELIVVLGFQN